MAILFPSSNSSQFQTGMPLDLPSVNNLILGSSIRRICAPTRPFSSPEVCHNQLTHYRQAVKEALILVATLGGPTTFARIGVMRALNRNVARVFNSSRKDHHWGRRKLALDDGATQHEYPRCLHLKELYVTRRFKPIAQIDDFFSFRPSNVYGEVPRLGSD